ncbi:MAG TPA: glycine cleavage system protein GcvH [Burkholderiales bacterium]|nr:glycine cleavage system protein GcvH [Burkholderiales bacterium]
MSEVKFTETHEWIKVVEGNAATVGITSYAQDQLGDLVYIGLPQVGRALKKGEEAAVVESVKAASDVKAPVSGIITEVNETLTSEPDKVNKDPNGDGWFFKMKLTDPSELKALMDEAAYKELVKP